MRFASLGSGSQGNALVARAKETCVMLDCGFSVSDTVSRLSRLDLTPEHVTAIIVTHEHDDHLGGVAKFASKYRTPIWLTQGTYRCSEISSLSGCEVNIIDSHSKFSIGDIEIQPFPVPHDAQEPVQYVLSNGDHNLGVMTDVGSITPHIRSVLSSLSALVLECNHDLEMLNKGSYPEQLKRRISGKLGHLDNNTSAMLLREIDCTQLQHVIAAHLSKLNNKPELAQGELAAALNCSIEWIGVADQELGFDWLEIV